MGGVATGLGLVALVSGGVGWAWSVAAEQEHTRWDHVEGVEVPVPWPLEEQEIAALQARASAEAEAAAVQALGGGAEGPDVAPSVDPAPLSDEDLARVARERAVRRGEALATVRLGCTECHGTDMGARC